MVKEMMELVEGVGAKGVPPKKELRLVHLWAACWVGVAVAWALGWWGFSVLWVALVGGALMLVVNRSKDKIRRDVEDEVRREFMHIVTAETFDTESVNWLNQLIERYWFYLEPWLCKTIIDTVTPILDAVNAPGIKSIKMATLTFGKHSPMLNDLKVHCRRRIGGKQGADVVLLDLTLSWYAPEFMVIVVAKM